MSEGVAVHGICTATPISDMKINNNGLTLTLTNILLTQPILHAVSHWQHDHAVINTHRPFA